MVVMFGCLQAYYYDISVIYFVHTRISGAKMELFSEVDAHLLLVLNYGAFSSTPSTL